MTPAPDRLGTTLVRIGRALPELARVSVSRHVAYRAELTLWILTSLLPLVMLAVWSTVTEQAVIAGYGQTEVARYFVATLIVRQLTGAWVVWELGFLIRSGRLNTELLRPFPPLVVQATWMITALPFRLAVLSPIVAALVWWRPDLLAFPGWTALGLTAVSLALAWALNFLVQVCFGMLAFWFDRSDGLFELWTSLWFLLSGYVAPMAFFPDAWRGWLDWLPFRATLGTPVELLGGFSDPSRVGLDLFRQAAWVVVAFVLARVLWTRGLARYGAFGS